MFGAEEEDTTSALRVNHLDSVGRDVLPGNLHQHHLPKLIVE